MNKIIDRSGRLFGKVIVIACVLVVGVFIWLFDFVAGGLINALINLVG